MKEKLLKGEQVLSLKDLHEQMNPLNRQNKKVEIEKRNLEASLVIKAHENLNKNTQRDELGELKEAVRGKLKANDMHQL